MLPLLRVIVLGCALLATLGLAAGFSAPVRPLTHFARVDQPARGPMLVRDEHPEWQQFLVQAAFTRARELDRLNDLPNQPASPAVASDERLAGLPAQPPDIQSDDTTGSISTNGLNDVIPIDIGESSSTELPIAPPDTVPPVERLPRLQIPDESSVTKPALRPRHVKRRLRRRLAKPVAPEEPPINPFLALFSAAN